jgi:SCF-associated factor 1
MHFADIPVEVFLDNLLPFAQTRDVLSLGSTNRFFAALSADDTFWKRKCQEDFNFTSQETARQSGWKNLYRGLRYPRIFVWGFVRHSSHHHTRPSSRNTISFTASAQMVDLD